MVNDARWRGQRRGWRKAATRSWRGTAAGPAGKRSYAPSPRSPRGRHRAVRSDSSRSLRFRGIPLSLVATAGTAGGARAALGHRSLALCPASGSRGVRARPRRRAPASRALDAGSEKPGYAARTLEQWVELAREDHTIRTALLDGRLGRGAMRALQGARARHRHRAEQRRVEEFIADKLEEFQRAPPAAMADRSGCSSRH